MIVPIEALFYLDVAKRAVDEVVSIGAIAGLGSGARLPARGPAEYLPTETLDAILVDELLSHPTPTQALCKLRANLGMIVPIEARYST